MTLLNTPQLLPRLVLFAQLSSAVYEPDLAQRRAALEALPGIRWKGVVQRPDRDVTVLHWSSPLAPAGGANLSVTQGTCVTGHPNPRECFADIDFIPVYTPHGAAPRGFWSALPLMTPAIRALGDPALPWHHGGHSLGGQTAQLLLADIPGTAWPINPPTGASHEFWRSVAAIPGNTVIPLVHEREFAHGWLVGLDYHQPTPFIWAHHGRLLEVNGRDGINIDASDHFIDTTLATLLTILRNTPQPGEA